MKAFVTGATGFIGSRVALKLLERGYDVYALTHSGRGAAALAAKGVHCVAGDVNDQASMRAAMAGSDVVFHIAGWYKLGSHETGQSEVVNVQGTRSVLSLARELGIPRIVYTSTVNVLGDTRGYMADETYVTPGTQSGLAPKFLTEYDRTKWFAHYHVVLPMIHEGAPIIIVMPGLVYGPGDPSLIGTLMRAFYKAQLPFLPGPETVFTFAHVDDVAEGHILAAEKGRVGESYLLTGPALSLAEAFNLWSEITGLPVPRLRLPALLIKPAAPLLGAVGALVPLPLIISADAASYMGSTLMASGVKAREKLGWTTRSLREGMAETFASIAAEAGPAPEGWFKRNRPVVAGLVAASALALAINRMAARMRG